MSAIPREKLDRLVGRWTAIQAELNDGPDPTKYASLSKEFSDLDPIVAVIKDLEGAEQEHADLRSLIEDPAGDERNPKRCEVVTFDPVVVRKWQSLIWRKVVSFCNDDAFVAIVAERK